MRAEIICEIGINHNGNLTYAYEMIELAKKAGANVAKFQLYDPEKLLNQNDFSARDWTAIEHSRLTWDQTYSVNEHCKKVGIEFMASCFDEERFGWLEELGVKRHKIASRSIYDFDHVDRVKASNKPYIVSLGMVKEDESPLACRVSLGMGVEDVSFLYCVSKYPPPLAEVNFPDFHNNQWQGFSDHTIGLAAAKAALAKGAQIVEKHFTLDRCLPGPDQVGSMVPDELFELCRFRDILEG
jgi:sialic acid synthase SpsE